MSTRPAVGIVVLVLILAFGADRPAWAQVTLTQRPDQIAVDIDGKPFTVFYLGGTDLNRPYLHPLRSASGRIVNRSFPAGQLPGETTDHPHHAGLFYGHGNVNGYNYWAVQNVAMPRSKDTAAFGRIVLDKVASVKSGTASGSVDVVLTWLTPDGTPLLTETRRTTFYAHPDLRIIDFQFDFAAIDKVVFRDTKEGTFAMRMATVLEEPSAGKPGTGPPRTGRLLNAQGGQGEANVWGKRSEWVDYSGRIDGEPVGVVMMDHPGNPRHPTYWHSRGYGLHSINPFGVSDFLNDKTQDGSLTLEPGQHVRFRYRVVIHPGASPAKLAELYRDFAQSPPGADASASTRIRWGTDVVRQKPAWYASSEARGIADSVLRYQSQNGGWPKNTDLAAAPAPSDPRAGASADLTASTIDNNGTTLPLHFLALMVHATGEPRYRSAFERGIDYLLAAQYSNGGWPQFYPLREGYYSRITFNDNAMANVLTVLRDAAAGKPPYVFVDQARRARAGAAVARGIEVILRTQVKQDGKLTAWCAQHDERTLAPAWGRAYEPPSLSGSESVGIVRFLMAVERPAPEVTAAIAGALAWFRSVAIHGVRLEEFTAVDGRRDRRVVSDPSAPPLWARFYELGTNRPIFLGRDSVVRYAYSEIEYERRNGYAYYGTWPASILAGRD